MVAITTALFNGFVIPHLSELGISDPNRVIESYSQAETVISPEVWDEARHILSEGYNRQMFALVACGAAQAAVALLLWKQDQKTISEKGLDGNMRAVLTQDGEYRATEANCRNSVREGC